MNLGQFMLSLCYFCTEIRYEDPSIDFLLRREFALKLLNLVLKLLNLVLKLLNLVLKLLNLVLKLLNLVLKLLILGEQVCTRVWYIVWTVASGTLQVNQRGY